MSRYHKVMEVFWLTAAVVSAGFVGYIIYARGWSDDLWVFCIMPVVAVMLWLMRRGFRKKMERNQDR